MTQKQTVIGIVPSLDEGTLIPGGAIDRLYVRRDYLQAIARAGAVPMILNPEMETDTIMQLCDGIVITGGADISPNYYKQNTHESVTWTEPTERFEWEREIIVACDKNGLQILGICYGMQRLNIHYGGTLYQDISSFVQSSQTHSGVMHDVVFDESFLGLEPGVTYSVNSRHHQALDIVAPGFSIMASTPDGIVEAVEGNGHFGVQWHPESDSTASLIYRAFVALCQQDEINVLEQQLAPQFQLGPTSH